MLLGAVQIDDRNAQPAMPVDEQRWGGMTPSELRVAFEKLYETFNRPEFVHPDPVEFLHRYEDVRDREVVGLVASSLAYGRVAQIMKSVSSVLEAMGESPARFLENADHSGLLSIFGGFRHRFTTADELVLTLLGARDTIRRHGSLEAAFVSGVAGGDRTVTGALCTFAQGLNGYFEGVCNSLIPHHEKGSTMKRLNLFLRWMVRNDDVDPGGWSGVSPARLVVPLDTHLFRIARAIGFTEKKSAGLNAALEITERFREIAPDDPVKYDFALTRLGIRAELKREPLSLFGLVALTDR
jgi:uncharacterized protein (TIGR02757 family)